ncbi:hypothetical protein [Nocardia caishijiensis]|uniref:Type VII secretion system (Wss) protein ESAT-6 n=1 Tax=Nocardia caishijiensis TaxID=184756 RepID=A0ABQ6YRC9_9NOCA|nr:hypothetical protein [Nocardia caishijiensis]KAF0848355.1 hypothetical protein FNL39_102503 [Nocardia caishijiensis]
MADTPSWPNIPNSGSADDLLDAGAEGLQYFIEYVPRYLRALALTGTAGRAEITGAADMNSLIYSKYDAERDMDLAAIERISQALDKVMSKVPGEIEEQRSQLTNLPSIWQGQAGDAAWNMLNTQLVRVEQDRIEAATISLELSYVATALRTAVRHKAVTVQSFWSPNTPDIPTQDSNGASRSQIDFCLNELTFNRGSSQGQKMVEWLTTVFIPHVEATYDKFVQLCKEVDTEVRRVYGVLVEALNGLDTAAYPMPQDSSKPQTLVQQPGNGDPSSGNPSTGNPSTDTPSTTPANTDDDKDDDKDDDDDDDDSGLDLGEISDTVTEVMSGLTSLVSSVSQLESLVTSTAETLSTGLASLSTSVQEGLASLSSQVNSLLAGGATFDVNGTQVSIATDAEGQLTVSTQDAQGNSHEYALTLDENGVPVITDDQSGGVLGSGTPETGTGTGEAGQEDAGEDGSAVDENSTGSLDANGYASEGQVPAQAGRPPATSSNTEEDGEHWAGQYPESQPIEPGGSGAQLAEAGPL